MRIKPGIRERIERDRAIADAARAGGQTRRQLAERFGVGVETVKFALATHGVSLRRGRPAK